MPYRPQERPIGDPASRAGRGKPAAIRAIGGPDVLARLERDYDLDYLGEAIRLCLGAGGPEIARIAAARVAFHVEHALAERIASPPGREPE